MLLDILTPSERLVEALEVSAVFLPGSAGQFEVLSHHAPIISSLEAGVIRYRRGEQESEVEVASGFAIVSDDHIKACVIKG